MTDPIWIWLAVLASIAISMGVMFISVAFFTLMQRDLKNLSQELKMLRDISEIRFNRRMAEGG